MSAHRYADGRVVVNMSPRRSRLLRDAVRAEEAFREHFFGCKTCNPDELCIDGERLGKVVRSIHDELEEFGE